MDLITTINTEPTSLVLISLLFKFTIELLGFSEGPSIIKFESFSENFHENLKTLYSHIDYLKKTLNTMWITFNENDDDDNKEDTSI